MQPCFNTEPDKGYAIGLQLIQFDYTGGPDDPSDPYDPDDPYDPYDPYYPSDPYDLYDPNDPRHITI
jgi:hypothetical protein